MRRKRFDRVGELFRRIAPVTTIVSIISSLDHGVSVLPEHDNPKNEDSNAQQAQDGSADEQPLGFELITLIAFPFKGLDRCVFSPRFSLNFANRQVIISWFIINRLIAKFVSVSNNLGR